MNTSIIQQARNEGYTSKRPVSKALRESMAIDAEVVAEYPCEECGGRCTYVPLLFHDGSYRSFARCRSCGNETEF